MAIICMAVHDTAENKRSELTGKTLESILDTVDLCKNTLIVIDNNSCKETKDIFEEFKFEATEKYCHSLNKAHKFITLPENVGTAKAINIGWKLRQLGHHAIKMDNDCIINQSDWVEEMEAAIKAEPQIGIVGLKRKDCWEWPGHTDPFYKSELIMLPHNPGERWIIAEKVRHVMGTCQMYNSALLDKIGYLYQPGLYGYDDVLASYRSNIAGFINVFLSHINIDHIDPGGTEYQAWKESHAGQCTQDVLKIIDEYIAGTKSIYHED